MASTNTSSCQQVNLRAVDQYSENLSAEVWDLCIGDYMRRTEAYRKTVAEKLRNNQCQHILDASCGTGVDSIMLLEEGFQVTSIDLSYKMLLYAQENRWRRRKEAAFDSWVIKRGDWLTLKEDVGVEGDKNVLFDAVLCIGNSFPVLDGPLPQRQLQKIAISNMAAVLKPGGLLIIDHVNFDSNFDEDGTSANLYYEYGCVKVDKTSLVYENGQLTSLKRNYRVDLTNADVPSRYHKYHGKGWHCTVYPYHLKDFQDILRGVFGSDAKYELLGDYKPLSQSENPSIYVHIIEKAC